MMANSLILVLISISMAYCSDTVKIEIVSRPKECSSKAANGDEVSMHYDGKLLSGKPFDSSYSRNAPFNFKLGVGQVISCWDQGIPGMCVGEKRKLTCPPEYAYGDRGFGDIIPAKSTLVFDIELLGIPKPAAKTDSTKEKKPDDAKKEVRREEEEGHDHDHEHEHSHGDSFEAVDTDGNGEISREEMATYIQKYTPEDDQENLPSNDEMQTLISEIFQSDDLNKDGVLSKDEFYHGAGDAPTDGDVESQMEVDQNDLKDEL